MVLLVTTCCFPSLSLFPQYLIITQLFCARFDEKQKKLISDRIPINKRVMNYE